MIGNRYKNLIDMKKDIEKFFGKEVNCIQESDFNESNQDFDFMIDYDFKENYGQVETIFCIKENGEYIITEV